MNSIVKDLILIDLKRRVEAIEVWGNPFPPTRHYGLIKSQGNTEEINDVC